MNAPVSAADPAPEMAGIISLGSLALDFAVPCPGVPVIPVLGRSVQFPVRRIYCVGRNYAEHAREMGHDPLREAPFFFMKPADAAVPGGGPIRFPPKTTDLQHEIELVVAIGVGGEAIPPAEARRHVFGYAVGIDLTRRDLQTLAKKSGRPWEAGKAFDQSAPVSPIAPCDEIDHPASGRIWLAVNGEARQDADLAQMIWSVPEIVANLSGLFRLAPGDLIFTGTPAGVGPLEPGDQATGGVDGVGTINVAII